MIRIKITVIILLLFVFNTCSSNPGEIKNTETQKTFQALLKPFLSIEALEKAGFEHFANDFLLLFLKDTIYLLNTKDSIIVKFKGTTPSKLYKLNAQGPGGMLSARSIFIYDPVTIAVFDIQKLSVLFFDLDLNYKGEIRVNPAFTRIRNINNGFIASGDFPDNKLVSILDKNFVITKSLVNSNLGIPFSIKLPPFVLNRLYLLNDRQIAYTYWVYLHKKCTASIFDILSGEIIKTLEWEQDNTPNQKEINENKNLYSSSEINNTMSYYIVNTKFSKELRDPGYNEIIIFRENGKLVHRFRGEVSLVKTINNKGDSRIFLFDEDKGILSLDLKEL